MKEAWVSVTQWTTADPAYPTVEAEEPSETLSMVWYDGRKAAYALRDELVVLMFGNELKAKVGASREGEPYGQAWAIYASYEHDARCITLTRVQVHTKKPDMRGNETSRGWRE